MKALMAAVIMITSFSASADVEKITGIDAQNMCSAIRSIYKLQTTQLLDFTLSHVVQLNVEKNSLYSFTLGTEDESITCTTKNLENTISDNESDVLKVQYNAEVTLLETDRLISLRTYKKAFNIQGMLAETVCSQLEMFNATEEQAQISVREQVLSSPSNSQAQNIFGLTLTVSVDTGFSCGSLDSIKTIQIPLSGW